MAKICTGNRDSLGYKLSQNECTLSQWIMYIEVHRMHHEGILFPNQSLFKAAQEHHPQAPPFHEGC
jgi:hypothetical protein